jgi:hypothetical protein
VKYSGSLPFGASRVTWTVFRWVFLPLVLGPAWILFLVTLGWQVSANIFVFWLMPLVVTLCVEVTRINGGPIQLWLATFLPAGLGLALGLWATLVARRFAYDPNIWSLGTFTVISVAFLILMLLWILLFPFEKGYVHWSARQLKRWRATWAVGAVLTVSFIVYYALHLFRDYQRLLRRPPERIDLMYFQWCALKGTFLLFFLLVIRGYFPQVASKLREGFRPKAAPSPVK